MDNYLDAAPDHSVVIMYMEKIGRNLLPVGEVDLQLELSVKLEHVSLERIDILEAKLRNAQGDLEALKKCVLDMKLKRTAHVELASDNVLELNHDGQILWNKLTSDRSEIQFLEAGWFTISLMVFLAPQEDGASVDLYKNGICLESNTVPFDDSRNTSGPLAWSAYFDVDDTLSVIATHSLRSWSWHHNRENRELKS
ncbi:hypothetical protein GQ600_23358 [Phytophthora cactorum]|nr:hypothetical protein GQ600_23358 [Phytophthora cactorum]